MGNIREHQVGELTITIDRDLCIATRNCIKLAPDVFEMDDDNICSFTDDPPGNGQLSDGDRERIIEACRLCPVDALIVHDSDGTQIVPPE